MAGLISRMEMNRMKKCKQRVFRIIGRSDENDRAGRLFDGFIVTTIFVSMVLIVLESFQDLVLRWSPVFKAFDIFCLVVFTVEYILRLWTADLLYPDSGHPRLRFAVSFIALIDLFAILPFFIPFFTANVRVLRTLRLIRMARVFRIFKLGRYIRALRTIGDVIKAQASQLIMSIVICFFTMFISAIIMFNAENPVQPDSFPNIFASLWWAICTLTTVGYGDIVPITVVGRFFAAVISIVGIGIIAIPTGIIAAGFSEVIGKKDRKDDKLYCPYCGRRLEDGHRRPEEK